jgi:NAD(P)-dependent dehydrogenase (short-subunit alcohol dehydrogenase family)
VDFSYVNTLPAAPELSSFVHGAGNVEGPGGNGELVLVHNAAMIGPVGAIGTLAADELQSAVAVNLTAPMLLTNAVMAAAGTQREITVLFISSGAARHNVAGWAAYSATKLAGESFFEALAAQHAGNPRIRVVNVNPGTMDTDMQGRIREHAQRDVYFPDRDRFVGLHERGELTAPAAVARRILVEHLGIASS